MLFGHVRFSQICLAFWLVLGLAGTHGVIKKAGEIEKVRYISTIPFASTLKLLVSVVSSTPAVAQNSVPINGTVTGRRGEPRAFVSVSLEGPGRYVAVTNEEGKFTIPNVTKGTYKVRVREGDLIADFTRSVESGSIDLVVNW